MKSQINNFPYVPVFRSCSHISSSLILNSDKILSVNATIKSPSRDKINPRVSQCRCTFWGVGHLRPKLSVLRANVFQISIDDDDVSTFGLPVDHGARFKSWFIRGEEGEGQGGQRGGIRLIGASGTRWILMLMRERSREDNTSTRELPWHLYTPCVPYSVFRQVN